MSDFLSSLSAVFTGDRRRRLNHLDGAQGPTELLLTTSLLSQGIKRCLSDDERNRYVSKHLKLIQHQFIDVNITNEYMASLLEQCLICNSLGCDASFAGIYAIQLAQSAQVWRHKLVAYTACDIILNASCDTAILMVATLQRDIQCSHIPSILLALSTAAHLMSAEFIPALEAIVCQRAAHSAYLVRRRAVACLGAFLLKTPELLESRFATIKAVVDKDPGTMQVAVQVLCSIKSELRDAELNPLVSCLSKIFEQVIRGKLPAGYVRDGVSGPRILLKLIELLESICSRSEKHITGMMPLVLSVLDRYERIHTRTAVAVTVQCCKLLSKLKPNPVHLKRVVGYGIQLQNSSSNNNKAAGMEVLGSIAKLDRSLLQPHQYLIVSQLQAKESVIVSKTLKLMMMLITSANVQPVYDLYLEKANKTPAHTFQQRAIDILISCRFEELDSQWFANKLMELNSYGAFDESSLNQILQYISANSPSPGFQHAFPDVIEHCNSEIPLDIFTITLWISSLNTPLGMGDKTKEAITSSFQSYRVLENVLPFCVALRMASVAQAIKLSKADLSLLTHHMTRLDHHIMTRQYLSDIERSCDDGSSTTVPDDIWTQLDLFAQQQVDSGACRRAEREIKGLDTSISFSRQSDSKTGSDPVEAPTTTQVWTSTGHVNGPAVEVSETDDEEDDDARIRELTNQIFSM